MQISFPLRLDKRVVAAIVVILVASVRFRVVCPALRVATEVPAAADGDAFYGFAHGMVSLMDRGSARLLPAPQDTRARLDPN